MPFRRFPRQFLLYRVPTSATEDDITFDMRHVTRGAVRRDATQRVLPEAKFSNGMCREAGLPMVMQRGCRWEGVGEDGEGGRCAMTNDKPVKNRVKARNEGERGTKRGQRLSRGRGKGAVTETRWFSCSERAPNAHPDVV